MNGRLSHSLSPAVLILASALCASALAAAQRPGGHLVIIGGGSRPAEITERFIQLAGGRASARLVVIGLASEDAKATAEHAVADFKALGVSDVQALPETTLEATRVLQHASGVYLSGGDQQRLVDAMAALQLIAPLREVWCRGGVIAGTSAGAAVMSAVMITGEEHGLATEEERFRSIQRDRIATTNGFGFLTNAIIDQHFITRKRLNRLFSAVLEHPQLLGIGIDESTALIVDPSERCEVIGERTVMLIDARHSRSIHTARDGRFGVNNLTVHLLVSGDRFDVKRRRPILSKK